LTSKLFVKIYSKTPDKLIWSSRDCTTISTKDRSD